MGTIAEYLFNIRTQGDLMYQQKKDFCTTFVEQNLERIRVGLNVESLTFEDLHKNLLLFDGREYTWGSSPLSKAAWEASEFAAEYRAGVPEELDESDILARFPPPNNGRATLVFEGDTVQIEGDSDFKFPASMCSIQHPEGGRVECSLDDAASLYITLSDRIGMLLRNVMHTAVIESSKSLIDAYMASFDPVLFPAEIRRNLAENHAFSEAGKKLTDADRDRLRDRFVDVILSGDTYSTLRPDEIKLIRIQTPFCM